VGIFKMSHAYIHIYTIAISPDLTLSEPGTMAAFMEYTCMHEHIHLIREGRVYIFILVCGYSVDSLYCVLLVLSLPTHHIHTHFKRRKGQLLTGTRAKQQQLQSPMTTYAPSQ
jgi:hypothetical protein